MFRHVVSIRLDWNLSELVLYSLPSTMSIVFAERKGITFTIYLWLIEIVSKYPSIFFTMLSPIINAVFLVLLLMMFSLLLLLLLLLLMLLSSLLACFCLLLALLSPPLLLMLFSLLLLLLMLFSLLLSLPITADWSASLRTAWKFRLPMLNPATWNIFTTAFYSSSPSMLLGSPTSLMHSVREYCSCSDILQV